MHKTIRSTAFIFATVFCSAHASASAVECIFSASNSVTTPNYHCSNNCDRWADTRPIQKLTLNMDQKYAKRGAFFKNPKATCSASNGCNYANIPTPVISPNGEQATLSFKTWSIPALVTITADICVLNASSTQE